MQTLTSIADKTSGGSGDSEVRANRLAGGKCMRLCLDLLDALVNGHDALLVAAVLCHGWVRGARRATIAHTSSRLYV